MEAPTDAWLGAMGSLLRKIHVLLDPGCRLPKGVKDRMHLLRDDLEELSEYLEDLSELVDLPPTAKCWVKGVRELSFDMEDYHDSFVRPARANINIRSVRGARRVKIPTRLLVQDMKIPKRLKWYRQVAHKLSEFRMSVQEAIERHERYELHRCSTFRHRFVSVGPMLPTSYEESAEVVIDDRMNEFINSLSNDGDQQLKVVSIVGSGCVGKTTFAKVLSNKFGGRFDCQAFIRVSKKPDMKGVLRDMLSQVQLQQPPSKCNELDLIDNIRKHLQDKRYLIIIDDLWAASVWNTINHAFPKGRQSSRIITTTEIEEVALTCCSYHSEHVFEVRPLDVDYSRNLFFKSIFGSERDCPEQFKEVSNKIVEICGGLPLATINIARLLARQSILSMDLLTYICDSLSSCLSEKSTSEKTRRILFFSYNNLPHYLKTCLLHLDMWEDGCTILKEDLVKQWVAEGYIHATGGQDMEKVAGNYLDELIDRRFIQPVCINYNNEVVSCTVHVVVRELIACKSAEENFIVVVHSSRKDVALSHKVRRLSLLFDNAKYAKIPANIKKSQVRSLALFGVIECMPCCAEFKLLRVLNLQLFGHHGVDTINVTGISDLFHLRYLKIASDVCVELPNHMQGLQCLETLDMHTRVTAVPSDIIDLTCLLHLCISVKTNMLDRRSASIEAKEPDFLFYRPETLPYCQEKWMDKQNFFRKERIVRNELVSLWRLGKLTNLQDLHLACSIPSSKSTMEALGALLDGHGNLKTLHVFPESTHKDDEVCGAPQLTLFWICLAPPLLERFEWSLHSCIFGRLPEWIDKALVNLCTLKIAVNNLTRNDVDTLGGLPALTTLSLYVHTTPGERIVFDRVGFKILSYLKFRCSAPVLKFEAGTMANLCKIKLCFNASGVDQHAAAAYVKIDHMPGLKEISAKIGAACAADAQSALKITVNNHPSNPRIDVQLLELMSKKLNEQDIDEVQEKLDMKLRTLRHHVIDDSFEHPMTGHVDVVQDIPSLRNLRLVPIEPTRWKLAFQKPVQLPIFTGCNIQDASGGPLQIILVDGDSGLPSALPRHLRINLFLLYANQVLDEAEDWSTAYIQRYMVPCVLLAGDTQLTMSDGYGTVNELWFTDNTQWLQSKLRIGARVDPGTYDGERIREAMTEPFDVREIPLVLGDDVSKLVKVAKGGTLHKKLSQYNIKTVQDLLTMDVVKQAELRSILGGVGMTTKWKETMNHAKSCDTGDKVYVYHSPPASIYLNSICGVIKIEYHGVEYRLHQLTREQKVYVLDMWLEAYEQRNKLPETDAVTLHSRSTIDMGTLRSIPRREAGVVFLHPDYL